MADTPEANASAGETNGPVPMGPAVERAEDLVDQFGERLGTTLGRFAARAREELEDIWAEAQNIRRNAHGE